MEPQALWANFRDAVANHYFDMTGRVGRAQFWYFVLVYVLLAIVAGILQSATWLPLGSIYNLAMLLPWAGMGARRLQDCGRDGRLIWLAVILFALAQIVGVMTALSFAVGGPLGLLFVPGLGLVALANLMMGIVLIWFWIQPGDPGPNAYGPPPPAFDPAARPVF